MLLKYATEISDFTAKWFRMSWADTLWWSKELEPAGLAFHSSVLSLAGQPVLPVIKGHHPPPPPTRRREPSVQTSCLWAVNGNQSAVPHLTAFFFFPPLFLHRSGNPKARSCSTWSAASAWTASPRRGLRSSLSVAPRWPASPGSHRSSRELERRERGGSENLNPPPRRTRAAARCGLAEVRKKSHNCTFVMSPSNYCSPSSPWQQLL